MPQVPLEPQESRGEPPEAACNAARKRKSSPRQTYCGEGDLSRPDIVGRMGGPDIKLLYIGTERVCIPQIPVAA